MVYLGGGDGHLYALNKDSGEMVWKFASGDVVHASPVIYKDRVYFGGFDGHMYALGKDDGALSWKFRTVGASYFPKGEIQQGALVEFEGNIYFGTSDAHLFYSMNKTSGSFKPRTASEIIIPCTTKKAGSKRDSFSMGLTSNPRST